MVCGQSLKPTSSKADSSDSLFLKRFYSWIPDSKCGKLVSFLILLAFFIAPLQKQIFYKSLKAFSYRTFPEGDLLPFYMSHRVFFFPSELILIALIGILLHRHRDWFKVFYAGPSKWLTFLALVAFLSIGCASSSRYPFIYMRFIELTLAIMLFHSIRTAFDKDNIVPFIKAIAWICFSLSLFESGIGLLQYFMQHSLGLKFVNESASLFTFPMPDATGWVFDALFHVQNTSGALARAMGTFYHPNVFGGFLFCGILSSFYLYFAEEAARRRKVFLSSIVFQLAILLLTFSRAALIALLGAIIFWFIFSAMRFKNTKSIKRLTLMLAATFLFCLALFYQPIAARGGMINYNKITQGADEERLLYQKIAWELFKERPLLGIGLNSFRLHSHRFFPEGKVLHSEVHNIYLLFAVETGILGLSCFLLFLFALLKNAWACIRTQEGLFLFSLFSGFIFIGCCDFYFIATSFGLIFFFGCAALLYVATHYSKNVGLREQSSN